MDLSYKWVETNAMPSLQSWRAIQFLYNDVIGNWGKPWYIWTDNSTEFAGSFVWLCKRLGIIHHYITVSNSKANGQVEMIIQMLKDCI